MQLTRTTHLLTIDFAVPLPSGPVARSVNVVLICADRVTLIDSGTAGAEQVIFNYLHSIGRRPEEIETLILTHSHPDHLGAARAIVDAVGCRIAAHGAERHWIEDVDLQARQRPVPGFHTLVGGSVPVDRVVSDGDTLDLGNGTSLTVLHTPGHSAGSISLWHPDENLVVTGDAVPVPGEMPVFDDCAISLASLERLASLKALWLVSAWEPPLHGTDVAARCSAGRDWLHYLRETARIAAKCMASPDAMELCRQVVAAAGLPPFAVNPLVARALMSCLD